MKNRKKKALAQRNDSLRGGLIDWCQMAGSNGRIRNAYLFRIILTAPYMPASFPSSASLNSEWRLAWNAAGV